MAVTLAVAGLALSGVGTVANIMQQQKAESSEKKAAAAQRRADELRQNREKRQQIREARIRRAAIEQSAATQGATGSTAVTGGASSIQSQLSSNLSFLDQQGELNNITSRNLQKASSARSRGAMFQSIGNFAGGALTYGSENYDTIFGAADRKDM